MNVANVNFFGTRHSSKYVFKISSADLTYHVNTYYCAIGIKKLCSISIRYIAKALFSYLYIWEKVLFRSGILTVIACESFNALLHISCFPLLSHNVAQIQHSELVTRGGILLTSRKRHALAVLDSDFNLCRVCHIPSSLRSNIYANVT